MLARIRRFFAERGVLEVETPVLGEFPAADPALENLVCRVDVGGWPRSLYLQTSPEHAMKRLLAAGSGSIYQISKTFRDRERGRYHHPEFTMLEWYRIGFDHRRLMLEVEALIGRLRRFPAAVTIGYRDALMRWAGLDPFVETLPGLRRAASRLGYAGAEALERNACLDLLLTHRVEPGMRADYPRRPVFIHGYPADQAALARTVDGVAQRFELYLDGIEIANGYHELSDPDEQRRRFEAAHGIAGTHEKAARARIDTALLAALEHGLPDCAGVALGIDRLLMTVTGASCLDEVLAFPLTPA